MTIYDRVRDYQNQAQCLGREPRIVFLSENSFWNLYAELDQDSWLHDHGVKALSEKTKVYTLLGMDFYVSDDMPEDEIYIGYHPTEFLIGAFGRKDS